VDRNQLKQKIKEILIDMLSSDELEEITTTGNIDGYSTPNWVAKTKNSKKKNKEISTNSTGYKKVNEALEEKDLVMIKKVVRGIINNMFRDIWLKRNAWNR